MSAETYGAHDLSAIPRETEITATVKRPSRGAHREPGWTVLDIHRGLDNETLRRAINIRADRRLP